MYKFYDLVRLKADLTRDEARRSKPYRDTEGLLTIGVGWNLDHNGLPDDVIDTLLDRGIDQAEEALDNIDSAWRTLNENRQLVLLNMAFNLGQGRLAGFRNMWAAIRQGRLEEVPEHMMDSKWAVQVGPRADRLVELWGESE